jgi:protein-S-isoprenylcysteine O-methyltransferase Ste14
LAGSQFNTLYPMMMVPTGDSLFRIPFFTLLIIFFSYLLWIRYSRRESTGRFSISRHMREAILKEAIQREGKARIVARVIFAPFWFLGFALYVIYPDWMTAFAIPLPDWIRWVMLAVSVVMVPFMMWGYQTLGKAWAHALAAPRKEHVLVTNGPYRYVRHPIYTTAFTFMITLGVVASNWLVLLPMIAGTVLIYAQVGGEEAALIDRFGDEYREYMKRTARFLPRWKRDG